MLRKAERRERGERLSKATSVTWNSRPIEMSHPRDSLVVPLATFVVVVAVYVAPLSAVSTRKYATTRKGRVFGASNDISIALALRCPSSTRVHSLVYGLALSFDAKVCNADGNNASNANCVINSAAFAHGGQCGGGNSGNKNSESKITGTATSVWTSLPGARLRLNFSMWPIAQQPWLQPYHMPLTTDCIWMVEPCVWVVTVWLVPSEQWGTFALVFSDFTGPLQVKFVTVNLGVEVLLAVDDLAVYILTWTQGRRLIPSSSFIVMFSVSQLIWLLFVRNAKLFDVPHGCMCQSVWLFIRSIIFFLFLCKCTC